MAQLEDNLEFCEDTFKVVDERTEACQALVSAHYLEEQTACLDLDSGDRNACLSIVDDSRDLHEQIYINMCQCKGASIAERDESYERCDAKYPDRRSQRDRRTCRKEAEKLFKELDPVCRQPCIDLSKVHREDSLEACRTSRGTRDEKRDCRKAAWKTFEVQNFNCWNMDKSDEDE